MPIYRKGGVTNIQTGAKFTAVKTMSFKEWVQPLVDDFLNYKTKEWRKLNINTDALVIVINDRALNAIDDNGETVLAGKTTGAQVRTLAKKWVSTRRPQSDYAKSIHSLNLENANKNTFHYVVVTGWKQSEDFFKVMKEAGYMRKGAETHRGHETAAVRMHGESAMKKLKETAVAGGASSRTVEKNTAYVASQKMRRELQALSDSLTPSLKWNSKIFIDRETKGIQGVDHLVIIIPETKASNLGAKQKMEKMHRAKMQAIVDRFVKTYGDMRINVMGSKTPLQAVSETVSDMLMDKKNKKFRSTPKAKVNVRKQKIAAPKVKVAKPQPLRTSGGKFTSAMNIQAILDQRIKQQVQDNMGEGGALVNRTGRFASSVSVEKVMQSRQGTLTAFYTYMKAPYQTFERGYAQGSLRRDPRKLIARSIREIAMETLNHKLPIRTRRV